VEWVLFFLCTKYVHIALSKARMGVLKMSVCIYLVLYLAFLVLFVFFKVDLAFFAYDYLATLV